MLTYLTTAVSAAGYSVSLTMPTATSNFPFKSTFDFSLWSPNLTFRLVHKTSSIVLCKKGEGKNANK